MSKDRNPVILTTTSEHLSRGVEAVLKRFPHGARPEKNALLNDLAAALRPGKNWGGLLADARGKGSLSRTENYDLVGAFPKGLLRPDTRAPVSAYIGAVERRLSGAGGIIDDAVFDSSLGRSVTANLIDGSLLSGIVIDIFEDQGGYGVCPITTLLLVKDGQIRPVIFSHIEKSPEISALVLEALQELWVTDWSNLLHSEGISTAKVIVGPHRGAIVVPGGTIEMIERDQDVKKMGPEAVRFVIPAQNYDADEVGAMIDLAEAALPALAGVGLRRMRIDPLSRNPDVGVFLPIDEEVPVPSSEQDFIVHTKKSGWVDGRDDPTGFGMTLSHVLGEALAFVLDYHCIDLQGYLYVDTLCREMTPKNRRRLFSNDWRILSFRDGKLGEWRLSDPDQHDVLRRRMASWIESERGEFRNATDMPSNSVRVLTMRSGYRNPSHWQRAVEKFANIR